MQKKRAFFRFLLTDSSTLGLLASNIFVIILSIIQAWSLKQILWIYWGQSVIIGVFHTLRIFSLKNFSTKGFKINDRPTLPTKKTKHYSAVFFAFHYGFFHFIYALFLGGVKGQIDKSWVLLNSGIFAINHFYSFRHNLDEDTKRMKNIGTLFFSPYARIVPMHLIIVLGFLGGGALGRVLFLSLKTAADVLMHTYKHRGFGLANT